MTGTILLVLLGITGYLISLYAWPFRPCGKCLGTGRNRGSSRRRFGTCRRCKGSGRRQRAGSRAVHRGALSAAGRARARRGRR